MAITTQCTSCQKQIQTTDDSAKVIRCPYCAKWQIVPGATPATTRPKVSPPTPVKPVPRPTRTKPVPRAAPFAPPPAPDPGVGARRRMYLFERAYVDYASRLRGFLGRLLGVCAHIWHWFWEGPGAGGIEVVLRILVVLSGIVMGGLYVWYEYSHDRALSFGVFFAFVLIAAFVGVLMWGWKAPVHVAARAASGATAAGVVLLVVMLAAALALAVFSGYLLVLFLLTALSFVVFVPMGLAHGVGLLWRGIARRCPYDDCGRAGLPIHVCSCGARYADLAPNFYGIFSHTCRHGDKEVHLPTMDFLGRKKLPRLCGHCKRPLMLSSFGELSERPIAVVGGPGAGKTVFLRQATREVRDRLAALPGAKAEIDSEAHERELNQDLGLLDRGQVLAKTGGDVMQAFALAVRLRKPKLVRALLYLFDAPGEHFATIQRFGRKQVIQHLSGIVLLVDPFALPNLAEHARRLGTGVSASTAPLDKVVGVLLGGVNQMQTRLAAGKCTVPLAVVIAKADALPANEHPFLADLAPADDRPADDKLSARCREALVRLGAGNSVRALEQTFATVRYFGCSALGRMPDLRNTKPFRAAGVAEPLLWLLGLDRVATGAAD